METPEEILKQVQKAAVKKANSSIKRLFLLGLLGGGFIALAGLGSTIASMNLLSINYGLGRLVMGAVFTAGLIMVVLSLSELFTGNCLMVVNLQKIRLKGLLKNWLIVYLANFCGALLVALGAWAGGLFSMGSGLLGQTATNIANGKLALSFGSALVLGFFCNLLVCLAVWLATGAKSAAGKVLAIFFPVMLFVLCGFEHSIANMFYLPAGALASGAATPGPLFATWDFAAIGLNLLAVTLGNLLGGISLALLFKSTIKK